MPPNGGLAVVRYYIVATLIVVALGSIVFARRLAAPDLRISARATGTPTVESPTRPEPRSTEGGFSAQGPWVLSALPACFDEQSRLRGPAALVAAKIPPPSERIAPGTSLRVRACTIAVREHDVVVTRGDDRLRAPNAALYRDAGALVLVARDGPTTEIRRY